MIVKEILHYTTDTQSFSTDFITVNLINYNNYVFSQVNVAADGSGSLILNADDEVLMIHSVRPAVGEVSWEIPRGGIDAGETPVQAASRELQEETQVVIKPSNLISLGYINPDNGILNTKLHLFFHRTNEAPNRFLQADGFEVKEIRWVPLHQVAAAILSDEITDSITIAAFGKAKLAGLI